MAAVTISFCYDGDFARPSPWVAQKGSQPELERSVIGSHTHAIRYVALWLVPDEPDYLVPDGYVEMTVVIGTDR
jgi:hypothetical protein